MISLRSALLVLIVATTVLAAAEPKFGSTTRFQEGDTLENRYEVTVTLAQPPSSPFSLRVYSTPLTATQGSDYKRVNEEVTFRPGLRSVKVPVIVYGDDRHEADETFRLTVEGLGIDGIFTIVDDDEPSSLPHVVIDEADVIEGTDTATTARFRVSLSQPALDPVTVRYETVNRDAIAGSDFVAQSGFLQFKPGERVKWIDVDVIADDTVEYHWEFFDIDLTDANGADIKRSFASGRIRDDDQPDIRWLKVHDAIAIEGTSAIFRLELSRPSSTPTVLRWAVTAPIDSFLPGPKATTPDDFRQRIDTIIFAPGEVLKEIAVPVLADSRSEADEYFSLFVAPAAGIEYDPREGRGIIIDATSEFDWPQLRVEDRFVVEGDTWTEVHVPLTLSRPAEVAASVVVATREPGELDFEEMSTTVTFEPGETTKVVTLRVRGDNIAEPLQYLNLDFTDSSGLTISRDSISVTILDDDRATRDRSVRH